MQTQRDQFHAQTDSKISASRDGYAKIYLFLVLETSPTVNFVPSHSLLLFSFSYPVFIFNFISFISIFIFVFFVLLYFLVLSSFLICLRFVTLLVVSVVFLKGVNVSITLLFFYMSTYLLHLFPYHYLTKLLHFSLEILNVFCRGFYFINRSF